MAHNDAGSDGIIDLSFDDDFWGLELSDDVAGTDSISDAFLKYIKESWICNDGKVDVEWIAKSAGVSPEEVIYFLHGKGVIYQNPETWGMQEYSGWETADEYLSGNLWEKLRSAQQESKISGSARFDDNIKALKEHMPPEINPDDIYVNLGSPWFPPEYVDDFINYLLLPTPEYTGTERERETGRWRLPDKKKLSKNLRNISTFGTQRVPAISIIERTMNMRTIRVTDKVPSKGTESGFTEVINREETAAAVAKQRLIIGEFQRWVWQDERRKNDLKRIYCRKYCFNVVRKFNGSFLDFPGMSEKITLYPYQKNAVARILLTPNTLLAHDVGSGKTYIMIAAAMELQRLGMAKKCMFVVPNNLMTQWESIFRELYPEANIFLIEPKNMTSSRRNKTLQQVIENEYDGIIICQSCFDNIPLSKCDLDGAVSDENDAAGTDADFICFDELGIDRLFVDEAHCYKNVTYKTSIVRVLGIARKGSVKSDEMMRKVHYIQHENNGGGVVMATGTPITNSISDIFIFQKYLQNGELKLWDIAEFDSWVGNFAEKTTEVEIAVDTSQLRHAERLSKFHNIPELTTILSHIVDFHSIDGGEGLPQFDGYQNVIIPRTPALQAYLQEISRRADLISKKRVDPECDNMLKITVDGRKAALDLRLVEGPDPEGLKDHTGEGYRYGCPIERCKVTECASRVAGIYHRTKDERLTQLVFCDVSTPKKEFNLYDDLRQRLIDLGVAEEEIAYIHDADMYDEKKCEALYKDVREGVIRVLIGSTSKLGVGVNVQDLLVAVHHLDVPWRPADMVQREGRILRTGNKNKKVEIYRYITEGSFDAYSWQILETKQRFIADILSGNIRNRSGSETDDTVLDYRMVKALALDDPLLKSREEMRIELSRLAGIYSEHIEKLRSLHQRYWELPDLIAEKELELSTCVSDCAFLEKNAYDLLTDKEKSRLDKQREGLEKVLPDALREYVKKKGNMIAFEGYRGFRILLPAEMDAKNPYLLLEREGRYEVDLHGYQDGISGIMARIDGYLDHLGEKVAEMQHEKDQLEQKLANVEHEIAEERKYADEIDAYETKLSELDERLGIIDE